jgi:hypothetical protein
MAMSPFMFLLCRFPETRIEFLQRPIHDGDSVLQQDDS